MEEIKIPKGPLGPPIKMEKPGDKSLEQEISSLAPVSMEGPKEKAIGEMSTEELIGKCQKLLDEVEDIIIEEDALDDQQKQLKADFKNYQPALEFKVGERLKVLRNNRGQKRDEIIGIGKLNKMKGVDIERMNNMAIDKLNKRRRALHRE
ncbi:MAG: hypothetical protein HZA35_03250 [Parcubacteria group bacterium]|nr:hypothetical protein [Parcubacteria group bacterium]